MCSLVHYTTLHYEYCVTAISAVTVCMSYICSSDWFTVQRWHRGVIRYLGLFYPRSYFNNQQNNKDPIPHSRFMLQLYDPRHTVPQS